MTKAQHLTFEELQAGLDTIRQTPSDQGTLEMIVVRPGRGQRDARAEGTLSVDNGLLDDRWSRSSRPNRKRQLTLINTRSIGLIAGSRQRWSLAGDQLYVEFDLSVANLPIGARVQIGEAIVEVSEAPHTACQNFIDRFGADALKFTNCAEGMQLRLRGVNTQVVQDGQIRLGDSVTRV